jgi:hypothetical protein
MAGRVMWSGNATDLLRVAAANPRDGASWTGIGWPKSPRALAGRLRRAQTPLRALGFEITFGREGRAGTHIIRMRKSCPEATAATVRPSALTAPKKPLIEEFEGQVESPRACTQSGAASVVTVLTIW